MNLPYLQEDKTPSTADFPKAKGDEVSDGETTQKAVRRSPLEEKREGVFYDELHLGLESSYEVTSIARFIQLTQPLTIRASTTRMIQMIAGRARS